MDENANQERNAGTPLGNISATETMLDEHTRGDHKIPHPDCGACKAAKMIARGQMPWEKK